MEKTCPNYENLLLRPKTEPWKISPHGLAGDRDPCKTKEARVINLGQPKHTPAEASQRPQPADPGTHDRIGGLRTKRAQPIAGLVTKVLDDEPTMAEDWP
ncbi:hypothetical protein N7537_000903 [Penicillium hordei]|uniref:Uncharacterized protein n=1 Tax=Penicillium hordei TaxID=40994 RepID=A0AAD6EFN8_9EURO|nr:uncharacterized protein N7537_000903 [Penicillium hordei]KAJ5615789.1 hypothetical protein N7537_000903 [Penicillium hordei]